MSMINCLLVTLMPQYHRVAVTTIQISGSISVFIQLTRVHLPVAPQRVSILLTFPT